MLNEDSSTFAADAWSERVGAIAAAMELKSRDKKPKTLFRVSYRLSVTLGAPGPLGPCTVAPA